MHRHIYTMHVNSFSFLIIRFSLHFVCVYNFIRFGCCTHTHTQPWTQLRRTIAPVVQRENKLVEFYSKTEVMIVIGYKRNLSFSSFSTVHPSLFLLLALACAFLFWAIMKFSISLVLSYSLFII